VHRRLQRGHWHGQRKTHPLQQLRRSILDGLVGIYHVPVHQENEDRRVVVRWVVQWVVVQWLFNGIIEKK
jgi:hypothetical protein